MPRWSKSLIAAVLTGTAAFFLWRIPPENNPVLPQCPLLQHTGFFCSGCGSLRALHFLLKGELQQAWAMNPFTLLLLPGLLFLATAELIFRRSDFAGRIKPRYIWAFIFIYLLFGLLRNLPFAPFCLLAPHAV